MTCPHCHLLHANPCADPLLCSIYQAQQRSAEAAVAAKNPSAPAFPTMVQDIPDKEPIGNDSPERRHTVPASVASNPSYYARFKIQPTVFIRENGLSFWQGNVIKYACRADAKNGVEDIDKAIEYLLKERAYLMGNPNWHMVTLKQGK